MDHFAEKFTQISYTLEKNSKDANDNCILFEGVNN